MNIADLSDSELLASYRENADNFVLEQDKEERDRLNLLLAEFMGEIKRRNIEVI